MLLYVTGRHQLWGMLHSVVGCGNSMLTPSGIKKVVEEKRLIRNKYRIACPRLCATAQFRECHFVFNLFL